MEVYDFYQLGLDDPITLSASHGIGIGDLLDRVMDRMPVREIKPYEGVTSFCVIGRPNVGKSSLVNAILKEDRSIVSMWKAPHVMPLIRRSSTMDGNI